MSAPSQPLPSTASDDLPPRTHPTTHRSIFRTPTLPSASLNAAVALRIGPLLLDTLFKHYLERKTVTKDSKAREELLYDAAWSTFRAFMDAATKHSVEELQQFSNVRIPAPPWVHLVRLRVPLTCCTQAAQILIQAFGGEEKTRELVGGVKWWQARGLPGVEAQWVCSKKDLEREERRLREVRRGATLGAKGASASGGSGGSSGAEGGGSGSAQASGDATPKEGEVGDEAVYSSGMDSMRCLLYLHGGGYYFGSVDQERYTMQRYARKMKGRVFAVDYRLAPQYPFPCALQDCIAAYLYLIRPPPGASHTPIPPNRIIFGGDSAGGGLVLALLQILRDTNLPLPGGAVLISPWCDLTHSFPSIFENTATDIVPSYGLSIHKPSTLWPPPPEDLNSTVRSRLRERIIKIVRPEGSGNANKDQPQAEAQEEKKLAEDGVHTHFTKSEEGVFPPHEHHTRTRRGSSSSHESLTVRGDTRLPPTPSDSSPRPLHPHDPLSPSSHEPGREEPPGKPLSTWDPAHPGPIRLTVDGKEVTIRSQIQLYCTNHQLTHPYVSPCLGYLGGLCPLLVIASDKEVLRDEIIYTAHKAARPDKFPLKEETRKIYPHLEGIEGRYGPTPVHLQVYDDTSHVLPLISFSTPAKYCYRAIAAFCVHVTPTGVTMPSSTSSPENSALHSAPGSLGGGLPDNDTITTNSKEKKRPAGMHVHIDGLPRILPESPLATTPEEEQDDWLSKREKKAAVAKPLVESPEAGPSRVGSMGLPHPAGPLQAEPHELAAAAVETKKKEDDAPPKMLGEPASTTPRKSHFSKLLPHSKVRSDGRAFSFPAHLLRSMSLSTSAHEKQKTHAAPAVDAKEGQENEESGTNGARDLPKRESKQATEDVAGPRFGAVADDSVGRKAGDPVVYQMKELLVDNMIRERVSRTGTIRPLEPPEELQALKLPLNEIGVIKENAAKRYLHGQALWDKRFASTMRSVEKDRIKHLKKARKDADRRATLFTSGKLNHRAVIDEDASWGWGWALDGEDPPPSSIVARRDTHEARRLARIADKSWEEDTEDDKWAGNRLWTQLADWLTGPGEKEGSPTDPPPFAESEANKAVDGLRRRETIASTNGRELRPAEKPDHQASVAAANPEPQQDGPSQEPKKMEPKKRSTLNPFARNRTSEQRASGGHERQSSLNIFRRLHGKKGVTVGGYTSS